jgi:hypothetical protein
MSGDTPVAEVSGLVLVGGTKIVRLNRWARYVLWCMKILGVEMARETRKMDSKE